MRAWIAKIPVNDYFRASDDEDWVLDESGLPIFITSTSLDDLPSQGRFFTENDAVTMFSEGSAHLFEWLENRPKYQGKLVISKGPYFRGQCMTVLDYNRKIKFVQLPPMFLIK